MYQFDWHAPRRAGVGTGRPAVAPTVWFLGWTSLLTDISSEMINGILPLYLVGFLRLSPLQFGVIDGLYQGVSAVLRLAGGYLADRFRRYKETAVAGYGLSAVCKIGLLAANASWPLLAATIALDRTGKGLRTAPRDAMITLTSSKENLATSFGVHRAMDAVGALGGPLVAFMILAAAPERFDLVFVASFCFAVVGVAVLAMFVDGTVVGGTLDHVARPALGSILRTLATQSSFVFLSVAAVVLSIATMSDAFIFLTFQQRLQFAPSVFPLLYVATSLSFAALAVPAGRLADRFGSRIVFMGGYLALGGVYVMLLAPGAGAAGAVLGVLGLGAYYAATDGVLMALAGRMLPPQHVASGLAVLATFTSLARFFSSVAFGWMWSTGDAAMAVRVSGTALIAAILIAALALSRINDSGITKGSSDHHADH
jgi:MFS family permease